MTQPTQTFDSNAAARFTRPLRLSATEDMRGYVGSHLGRALLFLTTFLSVVAVLLIFAFVIYEALPFFFK